MKPTATQTAGSDELPDLFQAQSGETVHSVDLWEARRRELHDLVVEVEYGGMPPVPDQVRSEELHCHTERDLGEAKFITCRILTESDGAAFSFMLYLFVPAGDGPFPVVLTGDGCWRYATDRIPVEVVRRGNILALFNRVELAPDIYNSDRDSGLYVVYPGMEFGALSAWAWGYHRCVDVLQAMALADSSKIAIVGHSRGGKTVLLAGATDDRIALTAPNNSGSGGAGCYRRQGPGSETLADTMKMIPYWFGPRVREYVGRESELPFDQHFLKALVAPRAYLSTEALGDLWANPTGTWQTHQAASEAYRFLKAEGRMAIWFREGGHNHGWEDWNVFLDFVDLQFRGKGSDTRFNENPFPELPPAYTWSAP